MNYVHLSAGGRGSPSHYLAQKVRRDFSFRTEAYAAARRGKPSPEEAGCRYEHRQSHAAKRAGKKELTLGTPARVGQGLADPLRCQ